MNAKKIRIRAALTSLIAGLGIMGIKFTAYYLSDSTAILSDALESIVNVVAASFALWAIHVAHEPPDENHPYGHGKLEYVTSIFEGGLISFAGIMITAEAIQALSDPPELPKLTLSIALLVIAGLLNGILGLFLVRTGKKNHSMALEADGKHVLSDFYTSCGLILGLVIVEITNLVWIDTLMAFIMAAILFATGIPLVKRAIDGLIDAADIPLLEKLLTVVEKIRSPEIINIHHVRAMRNGRRIHVDGHVVVPEFLSIDLAHDLVAKFEKSVTESAFIEGEMELHLDPCRQVYCTQCELKNCPIRKQNFQARPPLTMHKFTSPVDPTDREGS
ncbi:MAG: cation diffusion facilitator family transporter [Oligoflexia bacterium]|nr:cation diffusion facilitator family transporter [Oligoflexia bacterium]